jgi:hypothetical protein
MIDLKKYVLRQVNFNFLVKLEKTSAKASILLSDTYGAGGFLTKWGQGYFLSWKACLRRCVGSGVSYIPGENTDTVIPLIKIVFETNLVIR